MNNNPILGLVQVLNSGGNPMAMLQQMAGGNPQIAQVAQMLRGKNSQQLQQMAQNMARERGVDINEMIRQLGINNASYK